VQRRLSRPVISIGNLAAGGRAKTPLAALVATRLREMGERPAILSRGYARRDARDGVVVVRDAFGIRADLDRAGDEPMMLARRLDGVSVLVSSSRYLAGRLAEHHLGATVHVLDDGFQHFELHRDANVVVVAAADVAHPVTLPTGHLREPLDAAVAADAFIALDGADRDAVSRLAPGGCPAWQARRRQCAARFAERGDRQAGPSFGPVIALAGIAEPSAFFAGVRVGGWKLMRELAYRDHHLYARGDVTDIFDTARIAGARAVLTTEKDLVRLLPFRPFPLPVAYVPLAVDLDSIETFDAWLRQRLDAARAS
jgi:tetraacyldisaccharide 4'-kinase